MNTPAPKPSFIAAHPGAFVAAAVGLAALVLGGAILWQGDSAEPARRTRIEDAVDVVVPMPLREDEVREATPGLMQERVALEAGAWVQVADERGRIQQRYRARRLDPEPDRWVRMEQPHAVLFPSEGRVVTMRADRGRARIPKRAIQAGRLEGDVVIRVFRAPVNGRIVFEGEEPVGEPMIEILAEEAQFDEVLGEIRCDRWVDFRAHQVRSDAGGSPEVTTVTFKGEGLAITVDTELRTIERLVVDRPLGPIVITRSGGVGTGDAEGDRSGGRPRPSAAPLASRPQDPASSALDGTGVTTRLAAPDRSSAKLASSGALAPDAAAAARSGAAASGPSPGSASAIEASGSGSADGARDIRPYRLTLHENVVVRRINQGRESLVRGDRLVAIFAMESDGLRRSLACAGDLSGSADGSAGRGHRGLSESWSLPLPARLSLMALASAGQASPSASAEADAVVEPIDLVTIHYDGRMVMAPCTDESERLESADDVRLVVEAVEVSGRRFVEVEDLRTLARARCDRLVYRGAADTIDLEGSVSQPFTLVTPRLDLEGGAFHFDRTSGRGEIGGAGRMRLGDQERREPDARSRPASERRSPPSPGVSPPLPRDLEITWARGLEIRLADESAGGRIRSAYFQGDVKVDSPDFSLDTQGLRVYFAEGRENVLERIRAEGGAVATRLGDAGRLEAQVIDVALVQDDRGRPLPSVMEARGRVCAEDQNQRMWSNDLQVYFRPRKGGGEESPPRGVESDLGSVEVERVVAGTIVELDASPELGADASGEAPAEEHRGVQMLLRDGARVFAHRLEGDATKRKVVLLGPDVMIVQKNLVADGLSHLLIDEAGRTVTADGPGRFRYFRDPVTDAAPSPRDRPTPTGAVALDATWNDRMHFDDRGHAGGGSLDLEGGVRVRAGRSNREFSALDARTVQLDFLRESDAPEGGRASPSRDGDATSPTMFGSGARTIQRLIAKGDARLENQTWENDERTGPRRLFQVTGDHVEYDTLSGEALVAGEGSLLIHDTRGGGGVDVRGSSRFRWRSSMEMKQLGSQRFLVSMRDGVELLHAGLAPGDTFTLTCNRLETTLLRPGVGVEPDAPAGRGSGRERMRGDIDLGGAAEVQRIRGIGQVMVRAPDADIECEEFDYDIRTQMAQMRGREGRLVKVLQHGSATPIQAQSVIWDRQNGRMTVQSAGGAVGR